MLNFDIFAGLGVAVAIVLFVLFGMPWLRSRGFNNIYKDVKMGLLMFGYAFRDEKIKDITAIILGVVTELEDLDMAPDEKREDAVAMSFRELIDLLDLEIDEAAIETIVNIAVSYLPPTNQ